MAEIWTLEVVKLHSDPAQEGVDLGDGHDRLNTRKQSRREKLALGVVLDLWYRGWSQQYEERLVTRR